MKKLSIFMIVIAMAVPFCAQAKYVQGDANGDNMVNMDDLSTLINYLLTDEWPAAPIPEGCVDLGLPSGTMWASHNVGATNPEDYGNYYSWGELEPKENYAWAYYLWATTDGSIHLTKYNTNAANGDVDNKTVLDLEDDVAYVSMGEGWRMPSETQIKELIQKCTKAWTEVNGVYGQMLTGPNGNTIFLPAAGSIAGTSVSGAGTYGHYWSRDLKTTSPNSGVKIYMSKTSISATSGNRNAGFTVRAVYEASVVPDGDYERGDVNADGVVNMDDLSALINYLLTDAWPEPNPDNMCVDLGLPSGTLWATHNIGAVYPEDCGGYFGWGEVVPNKDDYSWANTQWLYSENGQKRISKYNTNSQYGEVDNLTELELEDDAAYVNWGPEWRMPSKAQLDELVANCTWAWTTVNGMNGQLVTGPNGNTIFLPAAGYRIGTSSSGLGTNGNYWTRSLQFVSETSYNPLGAFKIYINNSGLQSSGSDRNVGCTVRPVRAPQE